MFMVREVIAFCPGHISGYFKRVYGKDVATTGSIGAGIVISEGVVARVKKSATVSVHIYKKNNSGTKTVIAYDSPPIAYAMSLLSITATVTTECSLPIGAGFGLSAASLLATLTALDELFTLGLGEDRIAGIAHEAEITHRTGLGDVAACRRGGFVVRPFAGVTSPVHRYFDLSLPVCAVSFGPIHTPSFLGSQKQMDRVDAAFPTKEPEDIEDFFRLSRTFAKRSGLITPEIQEVLGCCDRKGVPASMTMLGNGVFAYGKGAREVLSGFGRTYELRVAQNGPIILEEVV
jgi:pantoate kinase